MTLQNGAGNDRKIEQYVVKKNIIIGTSKHNSVNNGNGHVRHSGTGATTIGSNLKENSNLHIISNLLEESGFAVEISEDGKNYTQVASEDYPAMKKEDRNGIFNHKLEFDPVTTRYVKVIAKSERQIPEWHGGKGNLGFLFVDEIVLN